MEERDQPSAADSETGVFAVPDPELCRTGTPMETTSRVVETKQPTVEEEAERDGGAMPVARILPSERAHIPWKYRVFGTVNSITIDWSVPGGVPPLGLLELTLMRTSLLRGDLLQLGGLIGAAQLNGKQARMQFFSQEKGRYAVLLLDEDGNTGTTLLVKRTNISLLAASRPLECARFITHAYTHAHRTILHRTAPHRTGALGLSSAPAPPLRRAHSGIRSIL